ncbi:murein L,D-transpeptidase catalytic domain family protein [Ensifer sp. ENS07]|nr:murein L,D-transpeptidase catalytic domain family protein [Ensifer sp. ENS07]
MEDTNSRARSRSIVIHGADYVSPQFAQRYGRIGRSEGCPALDHSVAKTVIDQLKLGSLLMHWKAP